MGQGYGGRDSSMEDSVAVQWESECNIPGEKFGNLPKPRGDRERWTNDSGPVRPAESVPEIARQRKDPRARFFEGERAGPRKPERLRVRDRARPAVAGSIREKSSVVGIKPVLEGVIRL